MATIRWYFTNAVDANGWQALSTTAQSAATLSTGGWVVSTGSTFSSEFAASVTGDRAATTFTANTVPDGTLDTTLKDAFRTPALTGTFASANWTFQFTVVGTVQAGAADGQIVFRLIKANADGSSATEITSAQQSASVITNVATTDLNGTLTFNPGAITMAGQYLFVQVAWKRTGAGGMTTTNVRLRAGVSSSVGTTILSSDFTLGNPAVTGAAMPSGAVINAPGNFSLKRIRAAGNAAGIAGGATVQAIASTITPPAVGNALVVLVSASQSSNDLIFSASWCTDNQGNTYELAVQRAHTNNREFSTAIFYTKVGASSAPFTITITGTQTLAPYLFTMTVVEYGGDGLIGKKLAVVGSGGGSGGAAITLLTTANTASITGEAIAVAAMCRVHFNTASSIVVENIGWTQELEQTHASTLDGVQAEHDSQVVSLSGTMRAQWTLAPTSTAMGSIAVFQTISLPATQTVTGTTITVGSSASSGHEVAHPGGPINLTGAVMPSGAVVTVPHTVNILTRVQATGKARLANSTAALTMTFASPPAVGSAVVVEVWGADTQGGGTPFNFGAGMVTDNRGNTYTLAVQRQMSTNTSMASGIYVCAKVVTSAAPFTVSLNAGLGHLHWWEGTAVEVGGLGSGSLGIAQTTGATGSGTAVATGTTATVTGEAFVAAAMVNGVIANITSLTEETVQPAWVSEAEELLGATWINGEALSRVTVFSGGTQANWTQSPTGGWSAVVAAFQQVPPVVVDTFVPMRSLSAGALHRFRR